MRNILLLIAFMFMTTQSFADGHNGNGHANTLQGSQSMSGGNIMGTVLSINNPKQYRNTPSAALFVPNPTATCQNVIGGAGMMPGVGFSISGSYTNANCERMEVAKTLMAMSQMEAAVQIVCKSEHAQDTDLCLDVNANRVERKQAANTTGNTYKPVIQQQVVGQQEILEQKETGPVRAAYTPADTEVNSLGFKFDGQKRQWLYVGTR